MLTPIGLRDTEMDVPRSSGDAASKAHSTFLKRRDRTISPNASSRVVLQTSR